MPENNSDPETILAQYADGPVQLEAVLNGLSESDLDLAKTPDTWTIRQIVHHIVDGDDIWKTCIKAALGNPEGVFTLQWYWERPQTEWAENWSYARRPIASSLALFRANRHHIVELIRVSPMAREKSIRLRTPHNEESRITIGDILEIQAPHVTEHIVEIQTILGAHGS